MVPSLIGLVVIPVSELRSWDLHPRLVFEKVTLGLLTEDIARSGVRFPLIVRKVSQPSGSLYQVIKGERRFRAGVE